MVHALDTFTVGSDQFVEIDGFPMVPRGTVPAGQPALAGQCVRVVGAEDPGPIRDRARVQLDGHPVVTGREVCVSEVVPAREGVGVVVAKQPGSVCDNRSEVV